VSITKNLVDSEALSVATHCKAVTHCQLAHTILRTPIGQLSRGYLSCAPVVLSQFLDPDSPPAIPNEVNENFNRWLIPEPWNGNLESAKLLFVGQNPSASFKEEYPTVAYLAEETNGAEILDYFETRFVKRILNGTRVKLSEPGNGDGFSGPNRFLSFIQKIALNLYGKTQIADVKPGSDYAVTEAVRCKSRNAVGVGLATAVCAELHMVDTLILSKARVVVCVGAAARKAVVIAARLPCSTSTSNTVDDRAIAERYPFKTSDDSTGRLIIFIQHSNARKRKEEILPTEHGALVAETYDMTEELVMKARALLA
jgi:uracil-DNA glycosylase